MLKANHCFIYRYIWSDIYINMIYLQSSLSAYLIDFYPFCFWQFLNILALSVLAVIWRNPEMMDELESGNHDFTVDLNAPALPTPLSKVDPPYAYRDHSLNYRKRYRKQSFLSCCRKSILNKLLLIAENFDMGGLVCTCMIAITLMMIYGTIKGKPSHLLPFFCLQLFDFAITTWVTEPSFVTQT